jgi:hypothetical protein
MKYEIFYELSYTLYFIYVLEPAIALDLIRDQDAFSVVACVIFFMHSLHCCACTGTCIDIKHKCLFFLPSVIPRLGGPSLLVVVSALCQQLAVATENSPATEHHSMQKNFIWHSPSLN